MQQPITPSAEILPWSYILLLYVPQMLNEITDVWKGWAGIVDFISIVQFIYN